MTDNEKKVKDILIQSISDKKSSTDLIKEHSYQADKSQILPAKSEKAKVVEFKTKRKNGIKSDLDEWNNRDFAIYILSQYSKKYGRNWLPSISNIAVQLGRVKEAVHDVLGFCDNLVFKDYIDSFFRNWSDHYKRRASNVLYLSHLRGNEAVEEFSSRYNYQDRLRYHAKGNEQKLKKCAETDLDNSYLLGDENFVSDHGIVLTCNWLIIKRDYDLKKAANYVAKAFLKIFNKGRAETVIKSTIKHSPYPSWFRFKNYNIILQAVSKKTDKEIQMKIEFTDDSKFAFLKGQEKKNG